MSGSAAARWLLLAGLWSLQFIFMRMAVPVFGSPVVADCRALLAALLLVPWTLWVARQSIAPLAHWKDHAAIGLVNNVLPFLLYAWAATVLPAGYLAVINGTVPLWTAVIAAPALGERLRAPRILGFALGIAGVSLIVELGPVALDGHTTLASLAAVTAAAFWGWAGVLIKQRYGRLPPVALAAGSIAFAGLVMLPALSLVPSPATWSFEATAALLALGLLCSGVAYLPIFTLIREIGPARTLSVGLAVPLLGILWGWLFLGEAVTPGMIGGAALVLAALALVMKR